MLEGIDGIRSSAVIGPDGTVFVVGEGHVYAVSPDGEVQWTYQAPGEIFFLSSPAVAADGTVYVGGEDDLLYALDPDGSLKWTYQTGDRIRSSPSIGPDGTVYVGSHDGRVHAIAADGTEQWSVELHCGLPWGCEPVKTTPVIAPDGTIYVGADDLYAIDPGGSVRWSLPGGGVVWTPVLGAGGTVYFTNLGGGIYAADREGRVLWEYSAGPGISGSPAIGLDGSIIAVSCTVSPAEGDRSTVHAIRENGSSNGGYDGSPWPTARGGRSNNGRAGG